MPHLRNRSRPNLRTGCTWSSDGPTKDSLRGGGGDPGPSGRVCVRAGQRPAAKGDAGGPRRRRGPTFPGRDPAPASVASRRRNAARRVGAPSRRPGPWISCGRPGDHLPQPGHRSTIGRLHHRPGHHLTRLAGRRGHGRWRRDLPFRRISPGRGFVGLRESVVVCGDHRIGRHRNAWRPGPALSWSAASLAPRLGGRRCSAPLSSVKPSQTVGGGWRLLSSAWAWRSWVSPSWPAPNPQAGTVCARVASPLCQSGHLTAPSPSLLTTMRSRMWSHNLGWTHCVFLRLSQALPDCHDGLVAASMIPVSSNRSIFDGSAASRNVRPDLGFRGSLRRARPLEDRS